VILFCLCAILSFRMHIFILASSLYTCTNCIHRRRWLFDDITSKKRCDARSKTFNAACFRKMCVRGCRCYVTHCSDNLRLWKSILELPCRCVSLTGFVVFQTLRNCCQELSFCGMSSDVNLTALWLMCFHCRLWTYSWVIYIFYFNSPWSYSPLSFLLAYHAPDSISAGAPPKDGKKGTKERYRPIKHARSQENPLSRSYLCIPHTVIFLFPRINCYSLIGEV